jgi:hypothetical protein
MDTTKLVVGQVVYMLSGIYIAKGKVVNSAPWGVEVKIIDGVRNTRAARLYFDRDGKACNASGGALTADDPWSWLLGTPEGGLWELVGDWKYGWRLQWDEVLAALYVPEIAALLSRFASLLSTLWKRLTRQIVSI